MVRIILCILFFQAFFSTPVMTQTKPFLVDYSILKSNISKIKNGNFELTEALSLLTSSADQALSNGPYSVTFKNKVPPSGDKRDFMSVGPYWWPDPAKPDGLPYIRRDGDVNPERFEINDAEYFKSLCNDIRILTLAYFYTDNRKYADKAIELLRIWFVDEQTKMNPNLNYGQAIPGITEGRGIGLIDTRGIADLIDGIQILKIKNRLKKDFQNTLYSWFEDYYKWLTTSPLGLDEADEHNNHGTYYDVQAVSLALFAGQKERAVKMLEEQTKGRIESQLKDDGSQPHELARTLSWGYSQMNLQGFFELARLAENVNMDLWNYVSPSGKSIKKAYLWMLPYAEGKTWESKQIKPMDISGFVTLSGIAVGKYPDIDVSVFLEKYPEKLDALFVLTH